jgi:hypothetical protein
VDRPDARKVRGDFFVRMLRILLIGFRNSINVDGFLRLPGNAALIVRRKYCSSMETIGHPVDALEKEWAVAGINVDGATDEADLADEADNAWVRGRITARGDG